MVLAAEKGVVTWAAVFTTKANSKWWSSGPDRCVHHRGKQNVVVNRTRKLCSPPRETESGGQVDQTAVFTTKTNSKWWSTGPDCCVHHQGKQQVVVN